MLKKMMSFIICAVLAISMTACGNQAKSPPESDSGGATTATEGKTSKNIKVAMVCSGSLGDNGIFDMGNEGLTSAKKDFGIEYKVLEGKNDPSLYYDLLKTAATNFNVVFVNPGYQFDSYLEEIVDNNPETLFVYSDGTSALDKENVISVSYREHEGSYLAGILAASMTTRTELKGMNDKKVVGFLGAIDTTTINNFKVGFTQGVKSIDENIEVKTLYVGDFNDPAKGKELALSLYDQGCDVIYAAASTSGDGAIALAKEKGIYCIGVDTDKSSQAPENVAGSMLKNVSVSFYDVTKTYIDGEALEKIQREGLSKKWVEMYFNDYMKSFIPSDIQDAMEEAQSKIINGEITVDEAQ